MEQLNGRRRIFGTQYRDFELLSASVGVLPSLHDVSIGEGGGDMKRIVTGPGPVKESGSYSQAIVASGTLVFTAGQIGRDAESGKYAEGIEAQTRLAITNLQTVLRAAGCDLRDIVRLLVFMADLKDRPGFDKVYLEFFTGERPVRTRVQAGALSAPALLEMEAIAVMSE
jgi:2-iminobutanoate/2-iminopropanoate deaminase